MANIAQPQRQIHYISELKKIFCGRNQQPVTQKFKIDTNISDDYYFQIINKNNQIVNLANRSFKVYGSYIDAKRQIHILFFTESYSIEDNVLHFHLNTNTNEYNEYITTEYKEIQFTIIETTGSNLQVTLRDNALAYRRPFIDNDTQVEIVYRDILTGINIPLTGSFGVGENINLFPGANSFAFGEGLITNSENQTVFGQYNEPDANQLLIFGNGVDDNNRNNIFTVDKYGNAYLSGARLLNNFDRTNISQLNNDIGYVTSNDIPSIVAGNGIKVDYSASSNRYTFSLSATIPSAVSQLVNDTGFITGYVAGSGISIDNGVINCTVEGGGGGATYTAGDGIGISEQNVISLTAQIPTVPTNVSDFTNDAGYITNAALANYATTAWVDGQGYLTAHQDLTNYALKSEIPTSTSQLTNDNNFISSIVINCWRDGQGALLSTDIIGIGPQFTYDTGYDQIRINYGIVNGRLQEQGFITSSDLTGFAQTSAIPTSTSQLTNDSQYMSYSTFSMYGGNGISVYHDTENDDWIISWKYGDVIAGYGLSSYVDEYQYLHLGVNESALTGISSDNQQKMFVDDTVQTSAFVLGYNKDYDIFTNTIQTNDGVLNVNPLSGIEDIEEGKTATFEHWITPSGNLTGITFASGQTFIGQLPDSFTSGSTQVFTRRVISKNNNRIQQISYAYEFDKGEPKPEPPTPSYIPFTFEASENTTIKLHQKGSPDPVTLYTSKNGAAWTAYTMDDTISLVNGDTLAFSGTTNTFSKDFEDNAYQFQLSSETDGSVKVYGHIDSLINQSALTESCFARLLLVNNALGDASELILSNEYASNCYRYLFFADNYLTSAPVIPSGQFASNCLYDIFYECRSLYSITAQFTDWGSGVNATEGWTISVAENGTFYKPSTLSTEYGENRIPSNWTVVDV